MKVTTKKQVDKWVENENYSIILDVEGYENCAVVRILIPPYEDLVVAVDGITLQKEETDTDIRLGFNYKLLNTTEKEEAKFKKSVRFKESLAALVTSLINTHLVTQPENV